MTWGSQGSLRHDMTKEEHVVTAATAATATELSPLPHAFAHLQCWPRLEETMSLCDMSNDKCCHCNMLYGCFSIKQNHLVLPQKCPPKFSSNSFIVFHSTVKVWRLEQWHCLLSEFFPQRRPGLTRTARLCGPPHWSRRPHPCDMAEAVSVTMGIIEKNSVSPNHFTMGPGPDP